MAHALLSVAEDDQEDFVRTVPPGAVAPLYNNQVVLDQPRLRRTKQVEKGTSQFPS